MFIGGVIGWVLAPPWLLSHGLIAADATRVDILLLGDVAGGRDAGRRRHHGAALRWRVLAQVASRGSPRAA